MMRRFVFSIAAVLAAAGTCLGAGSHENVWGFPIGVTTVDLKSAVEDPAEIRAGTTNPFLPRSVGPRVPYQVWTYKRDSTTYLVTIEGGRSTAVSIAVRPTLTALLEAQPQATADPVGVRVGDPLDTLLIKSGAVREIVPNSGLEIPVATVNVTRGDLHYNYYITMGRVQSEHVWIMGPSEFPAP